MKIAYYLNCISTHELPVALEIVKLVGYENVLYIDGGLKGQAYQTVNAGKDIGVRIATIDSKYAREAIENWDVMITGIRNIDLFERRQSRGLITFYGSERWFKPLTLFNLRLFDCLISVAMPGWIRMWVPSYRRMARRLVEWANGDPGARVMAEGPWARRDFIGMGVLEDKIVPWGYFVSPSARERSRCRKAGDELKVLWAGRPLGWKRVRDIERAVVLANKNISKAALRLRLPAMTITFTKLTGQSPGAVRQAMREHDVYVLSSDASEGWGAALSEALEEGMMAVGTFEAGASAAMLPKERLYHSGDVRALAKLLEWEFYGELPPCSIGEWTAEKAARRLFGMCANTEDDGIKQQTIS